VASTTRRLNERGVPCPSGADPSRNRHRSGEAWMVTTVAAILANPRYTGRQVWNRQPTHHSRVEPQGELISEQEAQRRSPSSHPPRPTVPSAPTPWPD